MAPTRDTSNLRIRWGERIRALRTERGLSLMQVASQAGTDKGYLARIERGLIGARGPSDDMRMRIADALGTRVENLFTYPDSETECPSAASATGAAPSPQSETPPPTPRSPRRRSRHRAPSAAAPERSAASDAPNGPEAAS